MAHLTEAKAVLLALCASGFLHAQIGSSGGSTAGGLCVLTGGAVTGDVLTATTGGRCSWQVVGATSINENVVKNAEFITDAGSANAVTGTTATTFPSAYSAGQCLKFVAAATNTGPVTFTVTGKGAVNLTKRGATALAAGNKVIGQTYIACYDGTEFQLTNFTLVAGDVPAGGVGPAGPTGANGVNGAAGATGPVGPTGAVGANGSNGAAGVAGAVGAAGPTGAAGASGSNGAAGATGPAGPTGAAGAGSSVLGTDTWPVPNSCQATNSATGWNLTTGSLAPGVPVYCDPDITNAPAATLHFPTVGTTQAVYEHMLPSNWNGVADAIVIARTGDTNTGHNMSLNFQSVCIPPGSAANPAFGTASTLTVAASSTANARLVNTVSALSVPGSCSGLTGSGNTIRFLVSLNTGSNTLSTDAELAFVAFKAYCGTALCVY